MQKWPNGCDDVTLICDPGIFLNDWSCTDLHAFLCERGNFFSSIFLNTKMVVFSFSNLFKE
jgi:hypothetical protein